MIGDLKLGHQRPGEGRHSDNSARREAIGWGSHHRVVRFPHVLRGRVQVHLKSAGAVLHGSQRHNVTRFVVILLAAQLRVGRQVLAGTTGLACSNVGKELYTEQDV